MRRVRSLLTWVTVLIGAASGCRGCSPQKDKAASQPSAETRAQEGGVADTTPSRDSLSPELQGYDVIGEEDATNRYPFTVTVIAQAPAGKPRFRACAGALIAPNLVLTAAQCVCRPQPPPQPGFKEPVRIDSAGCAPTATVITYTYELLTQRKGVESWSMRYEGVVRPHPSFEVLMDAQGAVVTHHADLALVRLEMPVQANILPIRLAREEAQVGEQMTVAGYGYIEGLGGMDGERRFTRERVLKFLEPDGRSASFGSPELRSYKGDTGGPCLRESAQGPELLGISSRGMGREAAFTSISHFRPWLDEEILLARRESSTSPLPPEEQKDSTP